KRVCIVDGHGVRVRVDRRHLVVEDGLGKQRRTRRYARATSGLKRLIVLSDQGDITLSAIRWLADLGIPWCHIARDGSALATSSTLGTDYPALRRAQVLATYSETGVELARYLITCKLEGQRAVLTQVDDSTSAVEFITRALDRLAAATSV